MYTPKPFNNTAAAEALNDISSGFDDKRTLCNVIRFIFESIQDDANNLSAARSLCLEALWMSKRMHSKLEDQAKILIDRENIDNDQVKILDGDIYYPVEEDDQYMFSIDWGKYNDLPARGNWD